MKRLFFISLITMLFVVFSTHAVAEGETGSYDVWASAEEDAGPLMINGWAYVDAPLVNGLVAVHDLSGRELAWGESTDENGFFSIELPGDDFPEDMMVTVMGGIKGNWPFFGSIKIWLHQYGGGYFQVNSLTTLVAKYAQVNPGITYDRALEDVRAFLEIPTEMPMETQMNYCDLLDLSFSSELFFKEAVKYRGHLLEYDDFISSLVDEMSLGEQHSFKSSEGGSGSGAASAVFGMVDFFSGLIYTLDTALNWEMAKKFYGGDTSGWFVEMLIMGGDASGAMLNYIVNKVDAMDAKLDVVIMSLGNIADQLEVILEALKKIYAKIEQESAFSKENVNITPYRDAVTAIYSVGLIDIAKSLHKNIKGKSPEERKKIIDEKKETLTKAAEGVWDPTNGVLTKGHGICENLIERDKQGESYFDLLCTALITTVRVYKGNPFDAYRYMESKYVYYLRILQQALQAYVEACHYLKKKDLDLYVEKRDKWIKGVTDKFLECVNRFVLNTSVSTIEKEFSPGLESGRILARAYALADRARSGLKKGDNSRYGLGDLSGQVLAYRDEYKSLGLTFKLGGSTVVDDKKQDVISPITGLNYMKWQEKLDKDKNNVVEISPDYDVLAYNCGPLPPGTYKETGAGTEVEVSLRTRGYDLINQEDLNMAMANGTYTGDWETFVKHEVGDGSFYLQSRYRTDLWMGIKIKKKEEGGIKEERLIWFVGESDRKPISFHLSNQGPNEIQDPKTAKARLQIGSYYIQVNEKSELIAVEDFSAATDFQVMTLSDADGKDYGVALRHVVEYVEKGEKKHKYGYVNGLFGYPYGYWARNTITARDGYEKDLKGYQYWVKTGGHHKVDLQHGKSSWKPYTDTSDMGVYIRGEARFKGSWVAFGKSSLQYSLKLKPQARDTLP